MLDILDRNANGSALEDSLDLNREFPVSPFQLVGLGVGATTTANASGMSASTPQLESARDSNYSAMLPDQELHHWPTVRR
jgi:hypothetical protein